MRKQSHRSHRGLVGSRCVGVLIILVRGEKKSVNQPKLSRMFRASVRTFGSASRIWKNAKQSPEEFLASRKGKGVLNAEFLKSLSAKPFEYKPQYLSEDKVDPSTKRPIPLNVELLQYIPLQVPKTHGHKVAEIQFRGYNEENLDMAGEFAARAGFYLGIPCSKVQVLKTEKRLYTVIKSPFAQAKSKENFKRTTFNRKIEAFDANPEVVDLWLSYINKHALSDVKYNVHIYTRETVDFSRELDAITGGDLQLPKAYDGADDPIGKKVEELLKSDTFKEHFKL